MKLEVEWSLREKANEWAEIPLSPPTFAKALATRPSRRVIQDQNRSNAIFREKKTAISSLGVDS